MSERQTALPAMWPHWTAPSNDLGLGIRSFDGGSSSIDAGTYLIMPGISAVSRSILSS